MLLLLHQCSDSIRMDQHSLDQRMCCVLCDQALMPPSYLFLKCLFPPSDMSCSFFTSPVNFFFFYRNISLLLTNSQSDWFDSWYNQVWRSQMLSQRSEGMEETGIFFLGKKKTYNLKHVSLPRLTDLACVSFSQDLKDFKGWIKCWTCFLFPLSNSTFAVEKETHLSFPDTETHELLSLIENRKKTHQVTTQLRGTLGSFRRAHGASRSPFWLTL